MELTTMLWLSALVFLVVVAPIWLVLHYRYRREMRGLNGDEREDLRRLVAHAERMHERLLALEAILDAETPGWRQERARSRDWSASDDT